MLILSLVMNINQCVFTYMYIHVINIISVAGSTRYMAILGHKLNWNTTKELKLLNYEFCGSHQY